jgi:hypothetical protein
VTSDRFRDEPLRDVATAAERLAEISDEQLDQLGARSVAATGAAEGAPDPLPGRQVDVPPVDRGPSIP